MHALGLVLIWTAIQVTVIFSILWLLLRFAGKSEPVWRSKIILAGLLAALVISAFSLSPWPCWPDYWKTMGTRDDSSKQSITLAEAPPAPMDSPSSDDPREPAPTKSEAEWESPLFAGWSAFLEQLKTPGASVPQTPAHAEPAKPSFTLSSAIAWAVLLGVGFGLLRLLAGIWLLRREVSRSTLLHEERVQSVLRSILGPAQSVGVEVRVTARLQSAATTGIVRPVILLPICWEIWTDEELHAVLAHEVNHIARRDCLTALFAEVARVLHFYHPLMHWLANRLRLEQELAADAQAARFLGGQKRYLCILAEMALSESSRVPAWPARAFLPSHRTFMRRIEMLKQNRLTDHRGSRWSRCAALAAIALATVFALGLRGAGPLTAQDKPTVRSPQLQADNTPKGQADQKPFPLTYVPDEAIAAFGIRPNQLIAQPALKPLAEVILKDEGMSKPWGIPMSEIEQIVWSLGIADTPNRETMLIAAQVRTSGKLDLESLKALITPNSPETGFYGGQLYLRQGEGTSFWLADENTLIVSDSEVGLKHAIDARNLAANREKRNPEWEAVAQETFAAYINVAQIRLVANQAGMGPIGARNPMTPQQALQRSMGLNPMFGPLWSDLETAVASLAFGEGIHAKVTAHSKNEEGAAKVKETLNALLVLGRNMIEQNQQMIGQLPQREQQMVGAMLKVGQEVLKTIKVDTAQTKILVEAKLPNETANVIVQSLAPAVLSAREAARRAQAMNQLKQMGIAMHNYHETHVRFPAPVMMGPDGKTPHSWRVAILPFIEEGELHDQYKFDEPWDSENNKKLLEKIPAVYRHPLDKENSTNTSFFALVGKNTLMGEGNQGTMIRDIVDGTSNTLMIVEAQRDIPWTKPEDIPYIDDRSKAPPKLGGWFKQGFLAVLGDGSVRFISEKIKKATLQNLIERNDGQPLIEDFNVEPRRPRPDRAFPGRKAPQADQTPPVNAEPSFDEAAGASDAAATPVPRKNVRE